MTEKETLNDDLSAEKEETVQTPEEEPTSVETATKTPTNRKKIAAGVLLACILATAGYNVGAMAQENGRVDQLKLSIDETIKSMESEVKNLQDTSDANKTDASAKFEDEYFSKLVTPKLEVTEKDNYYANEPQGNYLKGIMGNLTGSKKAIDEKLDKVDEQSKKIMDLSLKAYAYEAAQNICSITADQKEAEIVADIKSGAVDSVITDFEQPENTVVLFESCNVKSPTVIKEINNRAKVLSAMPQENEQH